MPPQSIKVGGSKMERTYIISRYRGSEREQKFNKNVARYFCKQLLDEGKIPVAPHIYYTQFLDDNFRDDRECGLKLGIMELRHSQSFLLVIIDGIISEGMKREIVEVSRMGIPGRIVTMTHEEIRQAMKVIR